MSSVSRLLIRPWPAAVIVVVAMAAACGTENGSDTALDEPTTTELPDGANNGSGSDGSTEADLAAPDAATEGAADSDSDDEVSDFPTKATGDVGHVRPRPTMDESRTRLSSRLTAKATTTTEAPTTTLPAQAQPSMSSTIPEPVVEAEWLWGVVVAGASNPNDPLLEEVSAEVQAAGYEPTLTNCANGAAQALKMAAASTYTVAVYVGSEADAESTLAQLETKGIAGVVAHVERRCPE